MKQFMIALIVLIASACPKESETKDDSDAGTVTADAGQTPDAGNPPDAGAPDAAPQVLATMSLFELSGTMPVGGTPTAVKLLDTTAAFHPALVHDFDSRTAGLGCVADHFDAVTKPAPVDGDAGSLRMVGYTGGMLLSGAHAGNPIVCVKLPSYYTCIFPTGVAVGLAPFAATDSPLGNGPISFGTSVGADFGALNVDDSPVGTLTVAEDLAAQHYSATLDAVFHPTCDPACLDGRVAVHITALAAASESMGWPYPSVGAVRCVFASAASVTVPKEAISAMLASDARLDTVVTQVVRLPSSAPTALDTTGNRLTVETGRGVFGRSPR